ncbi:hypothetical protein [Roseibacillus persicicus]|nr:hypothetical protein [Roseibacillus persicicus]
MRRRLNKAIWFLVHKLPWKPILIWGPWILVLLVLTFYGIENWRGQRALNKALALAKKQELSLRWEDYNPIKIPDEYNLAKSSIFDGYRDNNDLKSIISLAKKGIAPAEVSTNRSDFRKPKARALLTSKVDIRLWLAPSVRPKTEREAAEKLDALFPKRKDFLDQLHAETEFKTIVLQASPKQFSSPLDTTFSDLMRGYSISQICEEDARLARAQGDVDRALSRIEINNAFLNQKAPNLLVPRLIAGSIAEYNIEIAALILRSGEANSSQINRLHRLLEFSLVEDIDRVLLGELSYSLATSEEALKDRQLLNTSIPLSTTFAATTSGTTPSKWEEALQKSFDFSLRRIPSGWLRRSMAQDIERAVEQVEGLNMVHTEDRILFSQRIERAPTKATLAHQLLGQASEDTWKKALVKLHMSDGRRQLMQVAARLELHRLEHGKYPLALDELGSTPLDFFSGKALRYELKADGTPHLWSLGPDQTDDHGLPIQLNINDAKGDLVWMLTPIPGLTEADWRRATDN